MNGTGFWKIVKKHFNHFQKVKGTLLIILIDGACSLLFFIFIIFLMIDIVEINENS